MRYQQEKQLEQDVSLFFSSSTNRKQIFISYYSFYFFFSSNLSLNIPIHFLNRMKTYPPKESLLKRVRLTFTRLFRLERRNKLHQ